VRAALTAEVRSFVRATINDLFGVSCPTTVVWLVISERINSIECHADERLAHVSEKIFEAAPPITNGYAATSVISVVLVV
jgi:hypothetical protein